MVKQLPIKPTTTLIILFLNVIKESLFQCEQETQEGKLSIFIDDFAEIRSVACEGTSTLIIASSHNGGQMQFPQSLNLHALM